MIVFRVTCFWAISDPTAGPWVSAIHYDIAPISDPMAGPWVLTIHYDVAPLIAEA